MTIDYQIRVMDGMSVNEAVTENEDGSYTIFINGRLCQDKQRQAAYHAFRHIQADDFGKENVQLIELNAHEMEGQYANKSP